MDKRRKARRISARSELHGGNPQYLPRVPRAIEHLWPNGLRHRDVSSCELAFGLVHNKDGTSDTLQPALQSAERRDHARLNPRWLWGPALPVFASNGKGITREDISALLRVCSTALGYPPKLVGSHSLRKGGATALFAATGNMELVKRFGGWKSDAVHAYLYSDLHGGEQHGTRMLHSKPALQPQQRSQSTPALIGLRPGKWNCRSNDGYGPGPSKTGHSWPRGAGEPQ